MNNNINYIKDNNFKEISNTNKYFNKHYKFIEECLYIVIN